MKPINKLLIVGLAALVLPLAAHAAPVTWGSATAIVNSTDIKSTTLMGALSVTNLAGADFGRANGTTTTVNNGVLESGGVNVLFESMNGNESALLTNGVTVSSTFADFNVPAGNAAPAGNYKTVLSRHMGQFGGSPIITLSGLDIGQEYQIQLFASGGDSNTNNIAGGPGLVVTGSTGQYAVGRFTADALTQVLTISGGEPVMNALTIGTVESGPDTTPPDWTATWPQADPLSTTSLTVRARTNEAGTAYYVVLPDGATAPSAAQVKAGNDSSNSPATAAGSLALTANTEATGPVTGLTADTSYDVYFIAEDSEPNLQATPVLVNVSLVSPAFSWGFWTAVTDETVIQIPGGYTYGGVNFNGSDTTIDGLVFTGIAQNASGSTNGVTVGTTGFAFQSTGSGNSNVVSAVGSPQTWATVLDRVIGDDNNSAEISLTGLTPGTDYTVQFFSNTPDENINGTTKITSGGVESDPFGSPHAGGATKYIIASFTATNTSQSFSITGTEPTFSALVIGVESAGGNTFTDWIGGFSGLNGLTGFNDDADFDGLDNGLENFLGTAPNAGNAGLTAGTLSGNTFTFTHPQNATPASDVSAPVYSWSTDLQTFHADEASSGGITVDLEAAPNDPSPGTTTVTATITGTVPAKLFVNLGVTQE